MNKTYKLKVNNETNFSLNADDLDAFHLESSHKTFSIIHNSVCYKVEWIKKDFTSRSYEVLINGKKFTTHIHRPIEVLIAALGIEQKSTIKSGEVA
ncbi:MAG: hypothetical protein RQ756_01870, partial [Flavobacteriaceae bacterium]|nr:hypothetical protein [Flavobacteriaceae bacterium]